MEIAITRIVQDETHVKFHIVIKVSTLKRKLLTFLTYFLAVAMKLSFALTLHGHLVKKMVKSATQDDLFTNLAPRYSTRLPLSDFDGNW